MITVNENLFPNWIKIGLDIMGREPINYDISRMQAPHGGSVIQKKLMKERILEIPITIYAGSRSQLRERVDLLPTLFHDGTNSIVFPDETGKTYYGQYEGIGSWKEDDQKATGVLTIVCEDPIKYGALVTTSHTGTATINNTGTAIIKPIIEILFTGNRTDFSISLNGKTFLIRGQFRSNERVIIDVKLRSVQYDGVMQMNLPDPYSRFASLELVRGQNQLTFSSGADVTMKYRLGWK
ncbi:hypothetical protein BpsS140_00031 [Bacillus phage vB_BpsS-140]|nr:hypothetical protein BpsS140_00031 [Bacillus phage vB_BpsS-140]